MNKKLLFIASIVSLGGFLFGFDAAVISGVVRYVDVQFNLTDIQQGWIVSSPTLSAMLAMLLAGTISDFVGRKKVLISVAALYLISAVWSAMAMGFTSLFLARMLGGLAFGAALVLAPVYIAEISPAKSRGRLVSIQQLNIVLGFSVAYFSNYILFRTLGARSELADGDVWRYMLGIEAIPALVYLISLLFLPESPRWLMMQGKTVEAKSILNGISADDSVLEEINLLDSNESRTRGQIFQALLSKEMRMVLGIGIILAILQQITGVNAIYFYATTIFEASGIGADASFAQAVIVGIVNVVFTILAMALIDRLGRKTLLIIGCIGIALSMLLTSYGFRQASFSLDDQQVKELSLDKTGLKAMLGETYEDDVSFRAALKSALSAVDYERHSSSLISGSIDINAWLVLIGILGFVASFAISLGPVMWVLLSEIFPNWIRGVAISVVGFINSLTSWLVQFVFPLELSVLGNSMTYLIYAIFAGIGLLLVHRYIPETKGKSLEQLEKELVSA